MASQEAIQLGAIVIALWVLSWLALIFVYNDASERYESDIGCLWTLVVFALGPIAFVAYLFVRPPRLDEVTYEERRRPRTVSPTKVCWNCGTENSWNAQYCKNCQVELRRPARSKPVEESILCPNCGAANDPDARFCNQCGKSLR